MSEVITLMKLSDECLQELSSDRVASSKGDSRNVEHVCVRVCVSQQCGILILL